MSDTTDIRADRRYDVAVIDRGSAGLSAALMLGPSDETGRTSVEGVRTAGNITDPALDVLGSANAGAMAAGTINADLIAKETADAVRVLRSA